MREADILQRFMQVKDTIIHRAEYDLAKQYEEFLRGAASFEEVIRAARIDEKLMGENGALTTSQIKDMSAREFVAHAMDVKADLCRAKGHSIKYKGDQIAGILSRPSAERAQKFDEILGFSDRKQRALVVVEKIHKLSEKELAPSNLIALIAKQCVISKKINTKEGYGYNLEFKRPFERIGRFRFHVSYSKWERKTLAAVSYINASLTDGRIVNRTYHQGRAILMTREGSKADEIIKEAIRYQQEKSPTDKQAGFGRYGGRD